MMPNNFDFIRLVAAFLVLYGHSFVFLGLPEPLFLFWFLLGEYIFLASLLKTKAIKLSELNSK